MAIAYRGYGTYQLVGGGSASAYIAIARPATAQYGDVMLAFVHFRSLDPPYDDVIVPPSGWTEIASRIGTAGEDVWGIYWKRCGVSEASSYVFPAGRAIHRAFGTIVAYSGCVYSGSPIDTYSDTAYETSNTNMVAAGVTTTAANTMLVCAGAGYCADTIYLSAGPAGFATRVVGHDVYGSMMPYVGDAAQASTGASGDKTIATTCASNYTTKHAFLVALVPALDPPETTLVTPADDSILQDLSPAFVFGTTNTDSADVHVVLKVSLFADFRSLVIDTDSATDYADWEEAASPFSSWTTVGASGATAGNRLRYSPSVTFRYDGYYALVFLKDSTHLGIPVVFSFTVSPDATAALAVTLGGTTFYPTGACRITEETGGEASVIDFDINLAQYLAHPLTKGDAIAVASGIGGHARAWNGTVESWTFDGTVVHIHGLQDDAYLSRRVCTGNEASADLGQNLADFVTSYGAPLGGTNIDTATGVTMALAGGYKYLREQFTDALGVLPEYIYWVDSTGDIHFVDQSVLADDPSHELYEEDPSA